MYYLLTFFRSTSDLQVGKVCVDNCQQFSGFNITYRLELSNRNMSAEAQSCYTAVSVAQTPGEMWGLLYVNDTGPLSRPECQDLQYLVVAQEENAQMEASVYIQIILDSEGMAAGSCKQSRLHQTCC